MEAVLYLKGRAENGFLYAGVLKPEDMQTMVSVVFKAYIDLMRKVQTTYW